jgi:hypothetical protein
MLAPSLMMARTRKSERRFRPQHFVYAALVVLLLAGLVFSACL